MKKNYLKLIAVVLLCWMTVGAHAQMKPKWTIGVKGGWNRTSISRSNLGRIDETYSPLGNSEYNFFAKFAFTDWLAIRADLGIISRSFRMDRNLHHLDPVYTKYTNDYLMLPLMADFSFGGKKLRGHAFCGGFGSYWLSAHLEGKTYWMTDYYVYFDDFKEVREFNSEDQRFIAGAVGGLGLSYAFFGSNEASPAISLDALYYYDLVSHHKGYAHLSDPRYLNTLSITLGISCSF